MKFTGKIGTDRKLVMANRELLNEWINKHPDKHIQLEIKVLRGKRSSPQNRYYWGCIVNVFFEIFRNAGLEVEDEMDVHEILKSRFNTQKIVNEETGEFFEVPKSTTLNNTFEQEEYHEKCRKWAAEFWNVTIALPNEQMDLGLDPILITGDTIQGQSVLIAEKIN